MRTLRLLPSLMAVGLVALAACSAAPDDPATATGASALAGQTGDGGDDGSDNQCSLNAPQCTVTADPNGWADAAHAPGGLYASAIDPWLKELQQAGCTTPARFRTRNGYPFWFQTCPESVSSIPVPAVWGSFSRLVFTCTSCVAPAPAGYVNIGWLSPPYPGPSGCKEGACTGIPVGVEGAP